MGVEDFKNIHLKMKNKTTFKRTIKDFDHPYDMVSIKLKNLPVDEFIIMYFLLCNNDNWIVNRIELQKRLTKLGMSQLRFRKAWKNLENKHYIICNRFQGGVHWIINEDPNEEFERINKLNDTISEKPVQKSKTKELICNKPTYLGDRERSIAKANRQYYISKYNVDVNNLSDKELIDLIYDNINN